MPIVKKRKESDPTPTGKDFATAYGAQRAARNKSYSQSSSQAPEESGSIADSIMKRRKMADGGMVDDDNMETPAKLSPYDEDNVEATLKEIYSSSDDQIDPEPMDSISDVEDEDDHHMDMVAKIRKKLRKS